MKFKDMTCHAKDCEKKADFIHESRATGTFYPYCEEHHNSGKDTCSKCEYVEHGGNCFKVN